MRRNLFLSTCAVAALLAGASATAAVRHYCIAADEVEWDYAPSFPMKPMSVAPFANDHCIFVQGDGDTLVGQVYRKAVYRQYASNDGGCDCGILVDGAGTRAGTDREHLGMLGP
jgi:hypothetical protein